MKAKMFLASVLHLLLLLAPLKGHQGTKEDGHNYLHNLLFRHNESLPLVGSAVVQAVSLSRATYSIGVLFDSSGIDSEYQRELLQAVQLAFRALNDNDVKVHYIDITSTKSSLLASAQWIHGNQTKTVVSLLQPETLSEFTVSYENLQTGQRLSIFSPRIVQKNIFAKKSVRVFSLQMSEMALAVALLNRVEKVGVTTLTPVLDKDNSAQLELLAHFITAGQHRLQPIEFSSPIFVTNNERSSALKNVLADESNSPITRGILILATHASQSVIETAREGSNAMQMRWFSPYFTDYEEWATQQAEYSESKSNNNATFGIYSIAYVGARGWDNPSRRKTLRELASGMRKGTSPRVLSAILAYDAAWIARTYNAEKQQPFPLQGLSGEIVFDEDGYRRDGLYFGVSAVPDLVSPLVTLLQPSKWILEDVLNVMETIEGQYLITEYNVATSSMLTKDELLRFSKIKGNSSYCHSHSMEVLTHDPFNQMKEVYMFTNENLPQHLLIPNQHGYGITFSCVEKNNKSRVTLKIACTAGIRFSDPVKCFRSHLPIRQKRWAAGPSYYPAYRPAARQYMSRPQAQGYFDNTFSKRDDSNQYYYGSPGGQYDSATSSYLTTRLDIPIVSEDVTSTTQSTVGGPKLPELRQILKAAKPFVGSCVGSATGCAMCVLVLGRLPLGTLPPACTGPCFVGTFGSCGSLLGRAFSETTVICTELFRQGHLDVETFLADAEFGALMKSQHPTIYRGYHFLATPLVDAMRKSPLVTKVVAKFALPWANYMRSTLGHSEDFSYLGLLVHTIGSQICLIVGIILDWLTHTPKLSMMTCCANFSTAALISLLGLLSITFISRRKKVPGQI